MLFLKLILINLIVYFLEALFPEIVYFFGFIPRYALERLWTFVTSIFLHASFSHLFYNMVALFFFGLYFEAKYGKEHLLRLYFLSGIIGNIFFYLLHPNSTVIGLGASGAIFGIIGALSVLEPFTIIYINLVPVPLILAAILWFLLNLLGIFYPYGNIGYEAHLGGLITGILYGLYLKKKMH